MTGYNTFKCYQALKAHFSNPNYDFIQAHGYTRGDKETFAKRPDVLLFEALGKHSAPKSFLIANLSRKAYYVKSLLDDPECKQNYNEWVKTRTSLNYALSQALVPLGTFEEEFKVTSSNNLPTIFRRYLRKEINHEIFTLMMYHSNQFNELDKALKGVLIWEAEKFRIRKYFPFVLKKPFILKKLIDKWPEIAYNSPDIMKSSELNSF